MPVYNGVTWSEKLNTPGISPKGSVRPRSESRLTRQIYINDWADLVSQAASKAFLGFAVVATDWPGQAGRKFVSRTGWPATATRGAAPFIDPDWPNTVNNQFYYADTFEDFAGDLPEAPAINANGVAVYDEAKVQLGFSSYKAGYRQLDDSLVVDSVNTGTPEEYFCLRNCEFQQKPATKYQTIPAAAGLRWSSDNTVATITAFVITHETDITITIWPVPISAYNEARVMALVGQTNNKAFPPDPPAAAVAAGVTPFFVQKATGTLVWGTPGIEIIRMGDLNYAYKISLRMRYFPYGANKFFRWNRPGGPGYDTLVRPDLTVLFPSGDFTNAFNIN